MSVTVCVKPDQKRIVPGSYWYAYGSVAYDLSGSSEDLGYSVASSPSLCLVSGDAAVSCASKRVDVDDVACDKVPVPRKRYLPTGKRMTVAVTVCALLVLVLLAVPALLAASHGASRESAIGDRNDIATIMVSVESGDTLWSMAESHPIDGLTTQQCVKWIIDRNRLDSAVLIPGQILELPQRTVS